MTNTVLIKPMKATPATAMPITAEVGKPLDPGSALLFVGTTRLLPVEVERGPILSSADEEKEDRIEEEDNEGLTAVDEDGVLKAVDEEVTREEGAGVVRVVVCVLLVSVIVAMCEDVTLERSEGVVVSVLLVSVFVKKVVGMALVGTVGLVAMAVVVVGGIAMVVVVVVVAVVVDEVVNVVVVVVVGRVVVVVVVVVGSAVVVVVGRGIMIMSILRECPRMNNCK